VASEKKDYARLKKVLGTLLHLDEAFAHEYRDISTASASTLRKNKNYDEALPFTAGPGTRRHGRERAFQHGPAYYEKQATDDLSESLEHRPGHQPRLSSRPASSWTTP
jgi:hypothetical protein